jgi:hypothetical protein
MHSPERQALEEALKTEPAGSAKIQALADYAMLKEIKRHMQIETSQDELLELQISKTVLDLAIDQRRFSSDAYAYVEAFDSAGEILKLYFEKYDNPGQYILGDLKDINVGKGRMANN